MSYQIVRMCYSAAPWRLLDDDGREVQAPQRIEHPVMGWVTVLMPVAGSTRRECEAAALALLPLLAAQRDEARAERDKLAEVIGCAPRKMELQGDKR